MHNEGTASAVRGVWLELAAWLARHAPASHATIAGPPSPDRIRAAEAALGYPLDAQLRAWWGCHDGAGDEILPGFAPHGLDTMLERRRLLLRIADEAWGEESRRAGAAEEAGGPVWAFLPELVPVAWNGSGDQLFVDLRRGPRRGCVNQYAHEQGALHAPPWQGLAALLGDALRGLRSGVPVAGMAPVVDGGRLRWRFTR